MFNRFQLQARGPLFGMAGHYPEIPAGWPNRSVRRAVKQNRESRLPGEWRQALAVMPNLRAHIKAL